MSALLFAVLAFFVPRQACAEVSSEDLLTLLSLNMGGHDLATVAWANMTPAERHTLRERAQLLESMAEQAYTEKLDESAEVTRAVRWGTAALLADAWQKKVAAETDLSENALRNFYRENILWYTVPEAVRYRRANYPANGKSAASRAKKRLQKSSLADLKESTVVEWIEYERLEPALAEILRTSPLRKVVGPVKISGGYMLIEVLERREETPAPFEQCREQVRSDKIQYAIKSRLPLRP